VAERGWLSLHVFGVADTDRFLTDAVRPLVTALGRAGLLTRYFFIRYWEGGPHVRLRVLPCDPAQRDRILGHALLALDDHLAGQPAAPAPTGSAGYAALAAEFARLERRDDYDRRVRLHPCVELIEYRPEHDAYGDGATLSAVERHFTESSRIVLRLLGTRPTDDARATFALSLYLLTLATCRPDLDRLDARRRAVGDLSTMDAEYRSRRGNLLAHAGQLLDATGGGPGSLDGNLAEWLHSVRGLARALGSGLPDSCGGAATVLLRCTHLALNRLGIGPRAEATLGYVAARALVELSEGAAIPS
jgi:thiopeptide-type bacteriocin biosynthesis protein